MHRWLLLFTATIALLPRSAAWSETASPVLDQTADAITITCGEQKLIARLNDGSLRFETPYGSRDLTPKIESQAGSLRPSQLDTPPKVYRGKDSVAALLTFRVPNEQKLILHLDAFSGLDAVFVKSSLTASCAGRRDSYCWAWSDKLGSYYVAGKDGPPSEVTIASKGARLVQNGWVFLPGATGGLAVLTNGSVGCAQGEPFIVPVPRSRFLRPGETLDIGFGLSGVGDAAEAEALWQAACDRSVAAVQQSSESSKLDLGQPAPDWLRNADTIHGCPNGWDDARIGKLKSESAVVVSASASQSMIEKAHEAGLRVLVRVDYRQLQDSAAAMQAKGKLYIEPNEATPADLLDLAKNPNWISIDSKGNPRASDPAAPGLSLTCFHQPDMRQAALVQVCNIMNLGADGIFLDQATPVPECHGPEFGRHTHPDPDKSNNDEFEGLQQEIYLLVKTFGEEKAVVQNSGSLRSHYSYCDAQVRQGLPFDQGKSEPVDDWTDLQYTAEQQADAVNAGKVPVMLPLFGSVPADRRSEAVLYSYAYSRMYGWMMALSDDFSSSSDALLAASIYSTHLGKATEDAKPEGDALYRVFENGLVALNPSTASVTLSIPVSKAGQLTDVGHDREISASDGKIELEMAPQSGRVLFWRR